MDDALVFVIAVVILAIIIAAIVLPIIALVISIQTRKKLNRAIAGTESAAGNLQEPIGRNLSSVLQQLTSRVGRLEAAIAGQTFPAKAAEEWPPPAPAGPPSPPPLHIPPPAPSPPQPISAAPAATAPISTSRLDAGKLESMIGRRWLGWAAVALIFLATSFFLKYAFDNRWIGELGRVTIGVTAGVVLTVLGYEYHERRWPVFSQILTGGGVVILYLSAYASFGYYHLATQRAAFIYIAILIAETASLALLYDAPAIAVVALIGGFLNPVLLRSDRDQYRALFTYIFGLDVGTVVLLKHWWGLSSLAFLGTHLLFWLWYADNYHPRKLGAVIGFHTAVFFAFFLSNVGRRLWRKQQTGFEPFAGLLADPLKFIAGCEDVSLLIVNAFVFFATSYYFLNPNHHDWMGTFAIGMALVQAGAAKLLLDRRTTTRTELLLMIGLALTFVTLAIPIQLKSNWISMAWALEGLVILWVGIETKSQRLRVIAHLLLALALLKLVFWDTPWEYRPLFTPVVNKYFLSSLFVAGCFFAAALIYQKFSERRHIKARIIRLVWLIVGLATLWFLMTIETHSYFAARAALQKNALDYQHQRWLGQMTLSILWSIYAAVIAAIGFVRRSPAIRWAALSLFGLTVVKVMLIDIAVLQQLYRIIAFFVLGLLLLVVTWGYHKAFHSKESST